VQFPAAEKIVLVQDNLSPHTPASLYAAFPAPKLVSRQPLRMALTRQGMEAG
jgi:hypothetical protein